jgi:D-galactose 1-dehydrogenase
MTHPIRIAVFGMGKIARDSHLPSIARSDAFELAFIVSRSQTAPMSVPVFRSIDAALQVGEPFDAIAICTPPEPRFEICQQLMDHGCAMLLEKPPFQTLTASQVIVDMAEASDRVVLAAWHSRYASQIATAAKWAKRHTLKRGTIEWRENHAKWHPGQAWLWKAGGFGVFDPGINALSILTAIYPQDWAVQNPEFQVPENAEMPSAATFQLLADEACVDVALEFQTTENETWTLSFEAMNGARLVLSEGGAAVSIDGNAVQTVHTDEYDGVYAHFANLIETHRMDVDLTPLAIVEDTFRLARRVSVDPIEI